MELSEQQKTQLAATIGGSVGDLDASLAPFRSAAEEEYLRMILGQRVFTRGQDIREYRLYLLIQHAFHGRLPSEPAISALFQTTASQSRALLRAVMSKYQYELQQVIRDTLKESLDGAAVDPNDPGARWMTVESENIIDALNRLTSSIDGSLAQVSKLRGTVSTYVVEADTFAALSAELS